MENNLSIIEKPTSELADIMGVANDTSTPARSALAELRQIHNNIMGTKTVEGEEIEVAVIKAGSFCAKLPDGQECYSPTVTIRPYLQRFCYERWDQEAVKADGGQGMVVRTVFAKTLNQDLKDNNGTYNCGRPSGYVKDWDALPKDMQELMRSVKRAKVIFGTCKLDKATDADGNPIDVDEFPFKIHIKSKESYKNFDNLYKDIQRRNKLPIEFEVKMKGELRDAMSGNKFGIIAPSLGKTLEISTDESETLQNFVDWVQTTNSRTSDVWDEKNTTRHTYDLTSEESNIVGDIVDIEE